MFLGECFVVMVVFDAYFVVIVVFDAYFVRGSFARFICAVHLLGSFFVGFEAGNVAAAGAPL